MTTIDIPVTARAYEPGQKTHAEEANAARSAETARGEAAADAARDRQLDAALAREYQEKPLENGDGYRLQTAFEHATVALRRLTNEQAVAVNDVGKEVDAFRRRVPREHHGLAFTLAMFALDAATAGIAGTLAASLSRRVSQFVRMPPRADEIYGATVWSPARDVALNPPEAVASVVESFKQGFKQAGKAGREQAFASEAPAPAAGVSSGARIDFFSGLASAVGASGAGREDALIEAREHLRPTLRTECASYEARECSRLGFDWLDDVDEGLQRTWFVLQGMRGLGPCAPTKLERNAPASCDAPRTYLRIHDGALDKVREGWRKPFDERGPTKWGSYAVSEMAAWRGLVDYGVALVPVCANATTASCGRLVDGLTDATPDDLAARVVALHQAFTEGTPCPPLPVAAVLPDVVPQQPTTATDR